MQLRRLSIILLLLLAGGACVGFVAWQRAQAWLHAPVVGIATPQLYEVPLGASLISVTWDLHRRGIVDHPRLLLAWARFSRKASGMKAGEYQFQPGMSPEALLTLLRSGEVFLHRITFIEGTTFAEQRRALARNPDVKHTLEDVPDSEIMKMMGAADLPAEGQFYPDTYRFARGTPDRELLQVAYRRMQSEQQAAWESRHPDLPLATPQEALILASIVEKESALARERPLIAGVFIERLRRGMRLQTDPTVIYGMGESYDGNIHKADLLRDTPFNTYTRSGLPPTPICLPSADSLRAVAQPADSGAVYFVATGQGDGSHFFSRTLVEHEAAVQRYLAKLRASSH